MKNLIYLTILVFCFYSCNEQQPSENKVEKPAFDLAKAKNEIAEVNKEFMAFVAAGDSIGAASLYTQDAKFMTNGYPTFIGKNGIQSFFSGMVRSGINGLELKTVEIWGMENLLAEEGEYTLFAEKNEVGRGRYIVLWKKEDGKWKLFRDIVNSIQPPKE